MLIFDSSKQKIFYRVEGHTQGSTSYLKVIHFHGVKQTKRGWWVLHENELYSLRVIALEHAKAAMTDKEQFAKLKKLAGKNLRFVLDDGSRLCREDFKHALASFRARKRRQIEICSAQLDSARTQLESAISLKDEDIDRLKLTGQIVVSISKMWEPQFDLDEDDDDEA